MLHPLVLITGASRGLGREIARACAQRDYRLALVARNADELGQFAAELFAGLDVL